MRHRPDLRRPPGADRILWPLVDRTRGGAPLQRNRLVGTSVTGECPRLHGAPAAFFLSPRGRTSGRACGMACQASLRAALAAVVAHRVQPSKADPRSGVGRLAGASRVRGYESRARAPHPAPPHETSPEDAPRSSETWRYNHTLGKTSILFLEKRRGPAANKKRRPGRLPCRRQAQCAPSPYFVRPVRTPCAAPVPRSPARPAPRRCARRPSGAVRSSPAPRRPGRRR